MTTNRESPTLADYIVPAISPALIIGLVSSLVMFLAEVFYGGKYEGRLNHTIFYFSAGIVLVARISIVLDAKRAAFYGIFLSAACYVALIAFIEFPKGSSLAAWSWLINAILIGVIWWCANKLTWDCTFIDDNRPSSSKGLLAVAGFEKRTEEVIEDLEESGKQKNKTFFQRLREYRERKAKKPHTPGLTVIYFSIAALPIFGLGQSLIPAEDTKRRAFTFWLATVYVGSAMGLLLTTSFLGLRRYLRQKKVQMPVAMTRVWMGLGAVLIVAFLVIASILPRPYSETPIFDFKRAGSSDRQASKNAQMSEDAGKGEGKAGEQTTAGKGNAVSKKGEPGGKGKSGESKKGSGSDKGKQGSAGKDKNGKQGSGADDKKGDNQGKQKGDQEKNDSKEGSETEDRQSENKEGSDSSDSMSRFQNSSLGKITESIATFLKWLIFIAIAIFVIAFVFRGWLQHLGNFFPWAKRWFDALNAWWQRLFGGKGNTQSEEVTKPKGPTHRPFRTFSNPFSDGSANTRPPEELIQYSFQAMESWAADRGKPRSTDETPFEFASRLTETYPAFETDANRLAGLVGRLAYSDRELPAKTMEQLEAFWDRILEVPTQIQTEDYEVVS